MVKATLTQVAVRSDDRVMSAGQRILTSLAAGNYIETAAKAAGISVATLREWLAEAAALSTSGSPTHRLTKTEQALMAFGAAVADADAKWESRMVGYLEALSTGEGERVIVTEVTDQAGKITETKRRVEKLLPDAALIRWRLERKYPDRYGGKVEVTGAVTVEVTHRLLELSEQIAQGNIPIPTTVDDDYYESELLD